MDNNYNESNYYYNIWSLIKYSMNQFVEYLKFNYKNISHTTITKLLEK